MKLQAQLEQIARDIGQQLNDKVFNSIYDFLKRHPERRKELNCAFPYPKKVRIGFIKDCLAIEYVGPEEEDKDDFETEITINRRMSIYEFLEIEDPNGKTNVFPRIGDITNTNFFLGDAMLFLTDYFYDFTQVHEDFVLNGFFELAPKGPGPYAVSNSTIFYTDSQNALKIKKIDLLEVIPGEGDKVYYHNDALYRNLFDFIIRTKVPQYQLHAHKVLNEFIALINLPDTSEPTITSFVEKNPILLQLSFGFNELNPQKLLEWQDQPGRDNLKPDFMPNGMDGYANIMDFKLPHLKRKPVVGRTNRTHPSSELEDCFAQLETYEEFCSQNINKAWAEKKHGLKIENPIRYLIIGHSSEFSPAERQKMRASRRTLIFTYDEFIEMARFQLYRVR